MAHFCATDFKNLQINMYSICKNNYRNILHHIRRHCVTKINVIKLQTCYWKLIYYISQYNKIAECITPTWKISLMA